MKKKLPKAVNSLSALGRKFQRLRWKTLKAETLEHFKYDEYVIVLKMLFRLKYQGLIRKPANNSDQTKSEHWFISNCHELKQR